MENNSENHDPGFCETLLDKNEHIQTDEMPTLAHQILSVVSNLIAEGEEMTRAVALLVDCLDKNEHHQTEEIPTHAHQMLKVVSELLAEGKDGSRAVALLVDCLDAGILADMVLETMEHLPESCPVSGISMQTSYDSGRLDNHLSVDMVLETKEE